MEVDILRLGGWVNGGRPSLGGLIWRPRLSLATAGLGRGEYLDAPHLSWPHSSLLPFLCSWARGRSLAMQDHLHPGSKSSQADRHPIYLSQSQS